MSAKVDFRKAHTFLINAENCAKKHLDPLEWPATFHRFDKLLATFDRLADPLYEGPPEIDDSPGP